jgi:hypothetical protein
MTAAEARGIDQKLLDLAIQQAAALLLILPNADRTFITRELFFQVWNKFREHNHPLIALHILEIADLEFVVRANVHSTGTLVVERKNLSDLAPSRQTGKEASNA